MIRIEIKDMICGAEIDGEFAEVMTELTLAIAYICKDIAKSEEIPLEVVRESFMAAFTMTAGKEGSYDVEGEASDGASGIGH